jgi:hypothetical protein
MKKRIISIPQQQRIPISVFNRIEDFQAHENKDLVEAISSKLLTSTISPARSFNLECSLFCFMLVDCFGGGKTCEPEVKKCQLF